MLLGIIQSSSKICTRRASLYQVRSFARANELNSNNTNKDETEHKKKTVLSANSALLDAEKCIIDYEKMIRKVRLTMSHVEKAMESGDVTQTRDAVRDLKHNLIFNGRSSSRKEDTFPN